jgi:amidase
VTPAQYAEADGFRTRFNERFNAMLSQADAVVLPAGGHTFRVDAANQYGDAAALQPLFDNAQMQFTIPADFAGTPALTVPCGYSPAGLPYALQFMGPRLSEPLLCRIGHAYEETTAWHERRPPI